MNPGLTGSEPPLDGNKWYLMAGHRSNRQIHDKSEAALHKPAVRRPLLVESAAQTCRPCLQLQTLTGPHLRTKKKGLNLVKWSRTVNPPRLTYGLHEHNVVSGALAENNGLVSCSGDSAKCSRGWRWSDKGVHVPGELSHTGLITQQRACSDTEEMREPLHSISTVDSGRDSGSLYLHQCTFSVNFLPINE